jgi:BMFP domain-containing protein YqiC
MDSLDKSMKDGMKELEKDVNDQIRKALDNPLSKLK